MISTSDAYTALDERREAGQQAVTAAAIDAFTSIAIGMDAGELNGPPERYPTFALLRQEALEGMAELGAQVGPEFRDASALAEVPDLDEVSRLGGLLCEVLVASAENCSDPRQVLGLINAAAHAGRIRDLLA
ncbi:hypothetical protein ACFHYQ_08925 [Sphaerimonospora cavernae]|uniref:TetR family transcriptional regulator n=1 Tax=Sphaerimonospora cavernae TaxID=1740611 RepID=A0ABV6U1T2_9ACTN